MWANLLGNKEDNVVTVDMTGKSSGISANVNFLSKEFKANQTVKLAARVKNNFLGDGNALSVSQIKVSLSNSDHALEWSAREQEEEQVAPGKATVKTFDFMPKVNDVGESLAVTTVSVVVGKRRGLRLDMTNTVKDHLDSVDGRFIIPRMPPPASEDAVDGMSDINLESNTFSAEILQRDPLVKMSLEYDAPALVGEWFPVEVVLNNNEDSAASQLEVTACLMDAFDPIIAETTTLTFDPSSATANAKTSSSSSAATPGTQDDKQPLLVKSLEVLDKGLEAKCRLYVKCSTTGERGVRIRVSYSVQTDGGLVCSSSISDFLNVDTKEPFSLDSNLLSVRLRPMQQAYTDEPFFLSPKLKALTAHPISILDSYMEPRPPLKLVCVGDHLSQIKGCVLGRDFETKECIPVMVRRQDLLAALDVQEIAMGRYVIKWKRQDSPGESSSITSTVFDVPVVRLRMSGLHLTTRLPSHGVVRTPMVFSFRLHNRTERTMEFTLAMEPSESFMLSGSKQMQARVLPGKERRFSYVLYPLVAGEKVELPRLRLTPARINQSAQDPESILERLLPRTVTVLPKARAREEDSKKSKKQNADELDSAGGGFYILGEHIVLENLPHDQRRPKPKLRY